MLGPKSCKPHLACLNNLLLEATLSCQHLSELVHHSAQMQACNDPKLWRPPSRFLSWHQDTQLP